MTILANSGRLDLLSTLQRMVGVHTWTLDLDRKVFEFDIGRDFSAPSNRSLSLQALHALMTPEDIRRVAAHWAEAAEKGIAGPTLLPFIKANGVRSQVESACCLVRGTTTNSLFGVFRRPSVIMNTHNDPLVGKERMLIEYVEAFIENSPSATVVTNPGGIIISINQECLRFMGKSQRTEVLRKSLQDVLRKMDVGLGDIVAQVLASTKPMRGRYEMQLDHGKRHTLYWRLFALSTNMSGAPPRVFAFDVNAGGPRPP